VKVIPSSTLTKPLSLNFKCLEFYVEISLNDFVENEALLSSLIFLNLFKSSVYSIWRGNWASYLWL